MNRYVLIFILLTLSTAAILLVLYQRSPEKTTTSSQEMRQNGSVTTSSQIVRLTDLLSHIEYADTATLRTKGLSGRAMLPQDAGLFFVFEQNDRHGIWMKDMLFPIDIIWFDEGGSIVGLKENATPASFPEVFYPTKPARYVLETNAQFMARHSLKLGDSVKLP